HAHLCDHQQLAIKESKSDIALSGGKQCHSIKPEEKQFYNLEISALGMPSLTYIFSLFSMYQFFTCLFLL
ncbi:mCG1046345, partial [Mus musculus]